jgi:putative ABC transport system permease protein
MSLLTAQEKLRVIGVLKTIGMTPAQVVSMFNITAGSLGMLAVLVGVPFGLVATQKLLTVLSNSIGFGEINISLNLFQTMLLIPFIVIISVAGGYLPARWAANLFIVQVLRKE